VNGSIRVLSCNLLSGGARIDALLELVEREAVDLVCAQELSAPLAAALRGVLPYGNLEHDQIVRGNGIASRRPVDVTRIHMPRRDGWAAALSPAHWPTLPAPMEVVNVHISGPHIWPYFPNPVRRRAQVDALLAEGAARQAVPHAILGDFNSTPLWHVYRRMRARYVDAVLATNGGRAAFRGTWPHLPGLRIRGLLRIDHCFLWRLEAVRARTVDLPGSDHLGLLVELLPPAPAADAG